MQVATGEWLRTVWEWRQWIERRSFDVAMPDVRAPVFPKASALQRSATALICPLRPMWAAAASSQLAASIHYAAAIPNFQILEHSHKAHANKARITSQFPEPVNGAFPLDARPGLGVTVDEDAVVRYLVAIFHHSMN
ncbi:MAG: enolase C-terminal domain-like protein [Caldilineaceae bacterium]